MRRHNKKEVTGVSLTALPVTQHTGKTCFDDDPRWIVSNHGNDIDAGVAFLRKHCGDEGMIAVMREHPNMTFRYQDTPTSPTDASATQPILESA